jgi:hypothetical protein
MAVLLLSFLSAGGTAALATPATGLAVTMPADACDAGAAAGAGGSGGATGGGARGGAGSIRGRGRGGTGSALIVRPAEMLCRENALAAFGNRQALLVTYYARRPGCP